MYYYFHDRCYDDDDWCFTATFVHMVGYDRCYELVFNYSHLDAAPKVSTLS